MSFKKPKIENPTSKTIKWKGGDGKFEYWNGEENVEIEIDEFIVLEEMSSISGYCKPKNKGIWSNEVLDLQTEVMQVRIGNEIEFEGVYDDIKTSVKGAGGKFTNVVYALMGDDIVRFLFAGSGCSGWIGKDFNPMARQCGVRFVGSHEDVNGNTTFRVPDFAPVALTQEQINVAIDHCDILEKWLESRDKTHKSRDDREQNQEVADDPNQEEEHERLMASQEEGGRPYREEEIPF